MAKQTTKQTPAKTGAKTVSKNKVNTKPTAKNAPKKQFFLIRWVKSTAAYFTAAFGELKKVTWPTRKELIKSTGIVIMLIAIFTVVIFGFDTVFSYVTGLLYKLG